MITKIFYSLELFYRGVKYDEKLSSWYTLVEVFEHWIWALWCIFICENGFETKAYFYHKDKFKRDSESSNIWYIEAEDDKLKSSLLNIFKHNETADFNFFKDKEFYDKIPFWTVLTVTSTCNIFCYYCFNDYDYDLKSRNFKENLTFEQTKDIVDKLYLAWTRDIIITWGEPFTYRYIYELLDYLKEKGIFAHINTNGTLLSENTVKKLNDNRSINLMVSMHEFNNEDYYMVNRKGLLMTYGRDEELKAFKTKFTKKVANLKKIRNYKNLSLDFLTILSNKNILHFEKIYAWWRSNFPFLNDWQFFRLYRTQNNPWISREMISLAIYKMYKLNKKFWTNFKIVDSVPFCVMKDIDIAAEIIDGELSEHHNVKTIITTDWNIQIMSAFDCHLWSIFSNDILEVWNSDWVQNMLWNWFLPKECSDCKYKEECRWWSRMEANIAFGSYDTFDPIWKLENKKIV